VDKQWKEYTHDQHNGALYNGYGVDEYGGGYGNGAVVASKSSSLHKNYRGQHDRSQYRDYNGEYHGHPSSQYHPSLDRRYYEQQQQHHSHHSRRSHGPYEMNDRHPSGGKFAHQLQPDYYFMPHQRKYSSDVVRVFVDYDAH